MFPHCNIHKLICTYPNGKIHSEIDHVFFGRRPHLGLLDRSFRAADCDADHCLKVATDVERLAVSK
jgi:hypothetical protein